ncbi:MAG: hypothetical protein LKF36_10590 [Lactobacillus sp.]|jgi:hypothetical protein|nr:hypothetical protein [Lactobacillus sp.]
MGKLNKDIKPVKRGQQPAINKKSADKADPEVLKIARHYYETHRAMMTRLKDL